MQVMLFECRQRSLRWGLLLPVEAGAPEWRGVEVRALATYPREAEGVDALLELEASCRAAAVQHLTSLPNHNARND
jgi:hypothetical protein